MATPKRTAARPSKRRGLLSRLLRACIFLVIGGWLLLAVSLLSLRWIDPPFTAVQVERRVQAWMQHKPYRQRSTFLGLDGISTELQHAVIAAEDSRFYQHHGFDWKEIQTVVDQYKEEGGRTRGASTITQQLVKNLFFGTGRSYLRKGLEASLVPLAEYGLGKRRILELYLNVVEWGPGIYGAEAASRYHYATSARNVGRQQAARLAAILPAPLRWHPEHMTDYSAIILERMQRMGW